MFGLFRACESDVETSVHSNLNLRVDHQYYRTDITINILRKSLDTKC